MANEKKSGAQRRQAELEAAKSARNLRRHQEQSQDVADRAREMLLEEQRRHDFDYGQAAGPFAKEAAEFHVRAIRFLNTKADIGLNLARFAAESHSAEKRARHRHHARQAYDSVFQHISAAAPTSEEREAVRQKMATLRELLQSLGERL